MIKQMRGPAKRLIPKLTEKVIRPNVQRNYFDLTNDRTQPQMPCSIAKVTLLNVRNPYKTKTGYLARMPIPYFIKEVLEQKPKSIFDQETPPPPLAVNTCTLFSEQSGELNNQNHN